MKKNFSRSIVALSSIVAMVAPISASAVVVRGKRSGNSSVQKNVARDGGGTNIKVVEGKLQDEKPVLKEGLGSHPCKYDPETSTVFPLEFLKEISKDGNPIEFEIRSNNKILVKFPPILDACGKFKPRLYQNPKTKDVTIMIVGEDDKTYADITKCLDEKKFLAEDGTVDHDSIEGKNYSQYSYTLDYEFDKAKDIQKSLKLTVASQVGLASTYPAEYGVDKDISTDESSSLCIENRKISSSDIYLNKGKDALLKEVVETCKSKDAQKIAEARRNIGNAEALKDIADKLKSALDAAYLSAVEDDVKKIYSEMEKIESKIVKGKELEEKEADKLTKRYAELSKDLDEKFLNPAIFRLDSLMKRYAELSEKDDDKNKDIQKEKESIKAEIKKLNDSIYAFALRLRTDKPTGASIYSLMEKYALNDSAKQIEGIRLKSFLYSKVFPSDRKDDPRGKPLTFEIANQKQVKGEQNFERTLIDWSDVYLVGQGNQMPLKKAEAERTQAVTKMNQRWNTYQQTEYKNYAQYCGTGMTGGVNNPIQCQTFVQGIEKRRNAELKRREKDLGYIKTRDQKLGRMISSYNSYQQKEVERATRDEDYPYGSSYSGYESTFEENYPQYSTNNVSTTFGVQNGYNPQMYSMNGQMQNGYQSYNPYQQMNSGMQLNNGYQNYNPYQQMNTGMQFNNGYQNYNPYQQQYIR